MIFFFEDFYGVQQLESNAYEFDLNVFITISSNLHITTGLDYRVVLDANNRYDLPSLVPHLANSSIHVSEVDDIVTRALFTQITYSPFDSLRLVAGVRLEQAPKYKIIGEYACETDFSDKIESIYNRDKIDIIPRFAAIYYLNDRNIFKFLYGKAINHPSFFQNYLSLQDQSEDLEPEDIQTFELNYISSISSYLNLNLSIFHNTLNHLITRVIERDEEGNYKASWSANAGKMVTNGIELTLNAELFENFRLGLSGTFQKTKDKRAGYENIDMAYSPKFLGYLKASYRTKRFTLAVTGNYVSSMETFWDEIIGTGERIGDRVDGYFILGANLRIEDLFLDGLYMNIRGSNLLDTEIRYPTFTNNQWATRGTLGKGRMFLISLGYKF